MERNHVVLVCLFALSLACFVHLWVRPAPVGRKVLWTVIIFLPLLGPLAYGAVFRGLPRPHDSYTSPAGENDPGAG
jgi:hypothetical protein